MSKHSREPWRESVNVGGVNHYGAIVSDHGECAVRGADDVEAYGGHLVGESIGSQDRRRIIACVNVLAGVPTETIEILLRHGRHLEVHAHESGEKASMVAWVSEAPL